mgnify:CR=1 FL=1
MGLIKFLYLLFKFLFDFVKRHSEFLLFICCKILLFNLFDIHTEKCEKKCEKVPFYIKMKF